MKQDLENTKLMTTSVVKIVGSTIAVMGFVTWQVIVPIRDIQSRLVSIEATLQVNSNNYDKMEAKVTDISNKLNEHILRTTEKAK